MKPSNAEPITITSDQVTAATATLARAFADYPVFAYVFPNPAERSRLLPRCIEPMIRHEVRRGTLQASSPGIEGVAMWLPPDDGFPTMWGFLRSGLLFDFLSLGVGCCYRLLRVACLAGRLRDRHAPQPHWYLQILGVAPEHQGQGHAARLLEPMLARFDAEQVACCLDTETAENVAYYERFGFQTVGRAVLHGSDLTFWFMTRHPASRPQRGA